MRVLSILLTSFLFTYTLSAQPVNDECSGATFLSDINNFCSEVGAYTFEGATASSVPPASCWGAGANEPQEDVWFAFRATRPGVSIRMVGASNFFSGGTFNAAIKGIALYSDDCGNLTELSCNFKNTGSNVLTTSADVNVGDVYYLRVAVQINTFETFGTFQLCLSSFDIVPDPISDCEPGVLLCDKAPFIVPFLATAGNVPNEIVSDGQPCGGDNCDYEELQSAWYKWICDDPGSLTFNLTPLNPIDDLDFWVYELPNGIDDCSDKTPLLCMASGQIQGAPVNEWIRCHGPTGLRTGDPDDHEDCGCSEASNNNFLQPLQMEAGKAYALVVMNFSQSNDGFAIDFGGTGTFVGPDIDFIIDPEIDNQCDIDEITFINNSTSGIGSITSYQWNFGVGSDTRTSNQEGSHNIIYESFGTKSIVLRIETDAGCSKTLIRDIFIESCCDPDNTLQLDVLNQQDPPCPDVPGGFFNISGAGGSPDYLFSSDGELFNPITSFNGLNPGTYEVWVQDIKGCEDSLEVTINPAPEFVVDAGAPQNILLGCETNLNATILGNPPYTFAWDSIAGMSCFDCLDPLVLPPGTTTYTIRAQNEAGCSSVDSVQITVEIVRPFYIPNAFSPNNDGINDFFTGFAGKQVKEIQKMLVFDRWGNMLFENTNFAPGEENQGWDGSFRGKELDPAVFAYYFEVIYVDNVVEQYEGDVTLMR